MYYLIYSIIYYLIYSKPKHPHALADAKHYIMPNLDNGYFVMRIFIDLRKAFDTVDLNIL